MNGTTIIIAFGALVALLFVIMGVLKAAKTVSVETAGGPSPAVTAAAARSESPAKKKSGDSKPWFTGKDVFDVLKGLAVLALCLAAAAWILSGGVQETLRGTPANAQGLRSGSNGSDAVRPAPAAPAAGDETPNGVSGEMPAATSDRYSGRVLRFPGYLNCVNLPRDTYRVQGDAGGEQYQSTGPARPFRVDRHPESVGCPHD